MACQYHSLARAITLALSLGAWLPVAAQDVDLGNLGTRGFRIMGIVGADDRNRCSVSGAGDVNGDGLSDIIVGTQFSDAFDGEYAGQSFVVFGKTDPASVDLNVLGSNGFRIDGKEAYDYSGISVNGAGDVNGDGLADLIVGANWADPDGHASAGESYVVFGKPDSSPVDLGALGTGGFIIKGIAPFDFSGLGVSGAGDVNGDGMADLVVGASGADPAGNSAAGESYVVFGKADGAAVDLGSLGSGGFRIEGVGANDKTGHSVSGAGDVNGDGLADLITGAYAADPAGRSYVIFGKADSTPISLATLGKSGFRIDGAAAGDFSGYSVSGAGDVNGDGFADLIVSAHGADPGGKIGAGSSYVVFGKADTNSVSLAALGTGGYRMDGADEGDAAGFSVAGAGDVNGDGHADLIVGAIGADPGGDSFAGQSYLVYGKASTGTVDLGALGMGGFTLDGIEAGDQSGHSVSSAGDVNGDGLADMLIGSRGANVGGQSGPNDSYLVFSTSTPSNTVTIRARSANGNSTRTAFGIAGDGSNGSTPDARFWIDFADGADGQGIASSETVTLKRSAGSFPSPAASVSWQLQSTRQNWTSAEIRLRYLDSELQTSNESNLRIVTSPTGAAPFTPLTSLVNPFNNTISANIASSGYFFLENPDDIFADDFD